MTVIFIQCSEIWWKLINVRNQFIKNFHVVQTFQMYCRRIHSLSLRLCGCTTAEQVDMNDTGCSKSAGAVWDNDIVLAGRARTTRDGWWEGVEGKWDDSVKVISVSWLRRHSEGGPIPAAVHSQLKLSVYVHACSPLSLPRGRTVCPPPTGSVLAHKLMVASRMERWLEPSLNKEKLHWCI